jgi:hypothetical protein
VLVRLGLGTSVLTAAALACVGVPAVPSGPDLTALADAYDHPSATLGEGEARAVLGSAQFDAARALGGLQFVADAVSSAGQGVAQRATNDPGLRGSVHLHLACPGTPINGMTGPADEGLNGSIDLTLGIEGFGVHRSFAGDLKACRFAPAVAASGAAAGAAAAEVVVTAHVAFDFGTNVALGATPPTSLLVEVTGASLTVTPAGGTAKTLAGAFDLRIAFTGTLETRIDLASLGLGLQGTAIGVLAPTGIALRVADGRWTCGLGSMPCVLAR